MNHLCTISKTQLNFENFTKVNKKTELKAEDNVEFEIEGENTKNT